jgi:hypothetical protein
VSRGVNTRTAAERVILMDGMDLRSILNADIAFEALLDEKRAYAIREQRAFVSAREIVMARLDSGRTSRCRLEAHLATRSLAAA